VRENEDVCGLGPYYYLCSLRAKLESVELMWRAPPVGLMQWLSATPSNNPWQDQQPGRTRRNTLH